MKQHTFKIIFNGECIFEETRKGGNKAKKRQYILQAFEDAKELIDIGDTCEIHFQIVGARGWAKYNHFVGSGEAEMI